MNKIKILNFIGQVTTIGVDKKVILMFGHHDVVCHHIAKYLNIYVNNRQFLWNEFLKAYDFTICDDNNHLYFPLFENIEELSRFVLLVNSHCLIDIKNE